MTTRPYVVRRGDHLARLAHARGFDEHAAWERGENEELRARRSGGHLLAPGDVLALPEAEPALAAVRPHATNRYRARVPTVRVTARLEGLDGAALPAGEPYTLEGLGRPREGAVGADGRVALELPIHVREVTLVFERLGVVIPVQVGGLDPHDAGSGVRQRLDHLGFEEPDLERALSAFQEREGLPSTGLPDEATLAALRRAHGG